MELRVDGWRKGVRFAASHIIPGHPQCGRMHGHTYAVHCVLRGEPAGQDGFIVDFNVLGAALKRVTDRLDHKMLLPAQHAGIDLKESEREVSFVAAGKRYVLPRDDVELLPLANCSAELLAQHCLDALLRELGPLPNVREVEVGVDEGYG
ncbi:MAG: 6-carboxytetrahydropterin synthase, partial [Halobacteriales archaeon]|nr:6-carboxytetrahydropterin synthase [Halobacteriales archaeon]